MSFDVKQNKKISQLFVQSSAVIKEIKTRENQTPEPKDQQKQNSLI